MTVTEISIHLRTEGKLRGFATIVLDDCLVIHGIRIIQGLDRWFLSMPSKKMGRGGFADIVHPITPEFRQELEDRVWDEFDKVQREALAETVDAEY